MKLKRLMAGLGILAALCAAPVIYATVSNTTVQTTTGYGNGVNVTFPITFDFRAASWVTVTRYDTSTNPVTVVSIPQSAGSGGFTVSGTNVVMGTAPTSTQYLVINRNIPLTQPVALNPASVFPYQGMSQQLDKVTLTLQNLNAGIGGTSGSPSVVTGLPSTGAPYDLIGWNSSGSSTVNATNAYDFGQTTFQTGDILKFNGTGWGTYLLNSSNLMDTLNAGTSPLGAGAGGSGVSNSGLLTWGHNALTFSTSGATNLTLPTSGTVLTGTATNNNTASTIVKRDSSGNFSAGTVTANLAGNVMGNVTGNVIGNVTGTASNVTNVVAVGNGGTGQTTTQNAINALLNSGAASAGQFCRYDGANVTLDNIGIGDIPTGFSRTKLAQGTPNTLVVNDGSGNLFDLAGGAAGDCLQFDGVNWVSAVCGTFLGANRTLSNLDTYTSINQTLTPSAPASYNLGGAGAEWNILFTNAVQDTGGHSVFSCPVGTRQYYAGDGGTVMLDLSSNTEEVFSKPIQLNGARSGYTQISAGGTPTNHTVTLPSNVCSAGQYWKDDGSGTMSCTSLSRTDLPAGTANHVLINDGSGVMSSEATLAKSRGGAGADMSSVTFPSSGTIATTAGTQALTNKDIDGGTASNTSRITLPKASTATIAGLTRKQGTLAYDTTQGGVVYDNGSTMTLLAAGGVPKAPTVQTLYTSNAQTGVRFYIVAGATATSGAVYRDGSSHNYTVTQTIGGQNYLWTSGTSTPSGSTLTKTSGTGDSSITFASFSKISTYTTPSSPAPLYIEIELVGGGGGGGGACVSGCVDGTPGGDSFFGAYTLGRALAYVTGGSSGQTNPGYPGTLGIGGSGSSNSPAYVLLSSQGGSGSSGLTGATTFYAYGGRGGGTILGAAPGTSGLYAAGSGGTGAGGNGGTCDTVTGCFSGGGGGGGGYVKAAIAASLNATYEYSVGVGGTRGTGDANEISGSGAGQDGVIVVTEHYQ